MSAQPLPINPPSPNDHPSPVELHIEELVLHGFAPHDRHRIGDAVERELHRLLAERGILANAVAAPHLVAPAIRVANPSHAGTVGRQIAASVFSALPISNPSSATSQRRSD